MKFIFRQINKKILQNKKLDVIMEEMMKKILIFLGIAIIVIFIVMVNFSAYKIEKDAIVSYNSEFEQYKDKELYGLDLATVINKAVDQNTKNEVLKDDNGNFISNDENSIEIEIYMQDNEKTYKMETFYNAGTEKFVEYYGDIGFKCSKIEYHEKTGKIKYIYFEQLQTS